jgi:glycosyltransferase involved in cell wall biosynthesis
VIPLFNKAKFVEQAVHSALGQEPRVSEVVVVDDGSTDDGAARVEAISDQRVVLIRQRNCGVSAARNRGIAEARTELVALLDADDWFLPGFSAAIHAMVMQYPQAMVFACAYWRKQAHDDAIADRTGSIRTVDSISSYLIEDFYRQWSRCAMFCASSVCIRRSALIDSQILFPVGEALGEDQDVWFRLAEKFPIAFCPERLSVYRVAVECSATFRSAGMGILPCYERLAERLTTGAIPPALRGGAHRLLASHLLNVARALAYAGRTEDARRLILDRRAVRNPTYWVRCALQLLTA